MDSENLGETFQPRQPFRLHSLTESNIENIKSNGPGVLRCRYASYVLLVDVAACLQTTPITDQQNKVTGPSVGIKALNNRICDRSWSGGASHKEKYDGRTAHLPQVRANRYGDKSHD
jgi:hypothetical protein